MTESNQRNHQHRSHTHVQRRSSASNGRYEYIQPVIYFSGMVILLIALKIMHVGMIAPVAGAFGITLLAISKHWKFKAGVLISMTSMFVMVIILDWHWIDRYFVSIMSGEIMKSQYVFYDGLMENLLVLFLVWIYHRLLDSIHLHGGQRWFNKKSFVVIFKLLVFFLWFLLLFMMVSYLMYTIQTFTRLTGQDSSIISAALALLATGIPMIIYFTRRSRNTKSGVRQSRHHSHHRSSREGVPKNADFQ